MTLLGKDVPRANVLAALDDLLMLGDASMLSILLRLRLGLLIFLGEKVDLKSDVLENDLLSPVIRFLLMSL